MSSNIDFITLKKHSELTGFSMHAIRANIKRGNWPKELVWVKVNGRLLIRVSGYNEWVETEAGLKQPQTQVYKSVLSTMANNAGKESSLSPLPLT